MRKAIVSNLKDFILEFGKDFSFVGEEYKLHLPDKALLENKLRELRELAENTPNSNIN
ncbi:MAG: hypothetical protein LBQ76_05525 [Candidatus Fibromonas sp.]|nr:hypothetical protein [Candidatus Fibromonas sp.]